MNSKAEQPMVLGKVEFVSPPPQRSLVTRMADRYGIEPNKLMETLKATCFKGAVSNEQMAALLIVAEQHGLNPFTKEIYAFPDKNGGIVPVVGVDGWIRIINSHPHFRGMSFAEGPVNAEDIPKFFACTITRDDRDVPLTIEEHYNECHRNTPAWNDSPRRMLRHRSMMQCARIAFGFSGIYLEDEAERIVEAIAGRDERVVPQGKPATRAPRAKAAPPADVPISVDQATVLLDAMSDNEVTKDQFTFVHGIMSVEDLPSKLFDSALDWVKSGKAAIAG